jgi:hypothetical protein
VHRCTVACLCHGRTTHVMQAEAQSHVAPPTNCFRAPLGCRHASGMVLDTLHSLAFVTIQNLGPYRTNVDALGSLLCSMQQGGKGAVHSASEGMP